MRKSIILTMFLMSTIFTVNAQRVVALHSSSGVTVFSSINPFIDAYNAAQAGDTLYLPGGAFAAPSLIDKQLYIYGAGFHPDSTVATNPTLITGNFTLGENSDYLMVEGVQFANAILTNNNVSASFVSFKRCRINGGINFQGDGSTNLSINNAFTECILIGDLSFVNVTNSGIMNCIIQNRILSSKSNVFKNCIFLYNNGIGDGVMHSPYYNEFSNNIFIIANPAYLIYNVNDGNIHNNNLFVGATPNYGANSIVSGNYTGVSLTSIFVSHSGYAFAYSSDFHLQSPTTYMGNDASQIGVYGGYFPFKAGAVPSNPHISTKIIAPQTTVNGDLQIQIQVEAQQD
jgi:hypothetical protein